jgi:hypothetical protein
MGMAGRSRIGSRLVSLMAAAATLLATWLPLGRACACGPVGPASVTAAPEPAVCPCCGKRPAGDDAPRPCCPSHAKPDQPAPATGCGCGVQGGPVNPEPTAPPRPAESDDGPVLTAALAAPPADLVPVPVGLSGQVADHLADPPPIDLVISLSRFTC